MDIQAIRAFLTSNRVRVACTSLALLSFGCDDDDGANGSGVEGSKKIASLSNAEWQKVCSSSNAQLSGENNPKVRTGSCKYFGAYFFGAFSSVLSVDGGTFDLEECNAEIADCDHPKDSGSDAESGADICKTEILSTCQATVADLEGCFAEVVDKLASFANAKCEDVVGEDGKLEDRFVMDGSESCSKRLANCFPDEDESDAGFTL